MNNLKNVLTQLRKGLLTPALEYKAGINNYVNDIIKKANDNTMSEIDFYNIDIILDIANIIYNNTDLDDSEQIIDNDIYDYLIELHKCGTYARNQKTGAEVIEFLDYHKKEKIEKELHCPIGLLSDYNVDDMIFKEELFNQQYTPNHYYSYPTDNLRCPIAFYPIGDGGRNTRHEHPNLVGTLQKCKFVMISQAEVIGVVNDSNVKILERDFFNLHFEKGYLAGGRRIRGIISLKYDGISVDITLRAEMTGRGRRVIAIAGTTRGDVEEDKGKDVTHVIYGYDFYNANPDHFIDEIGLKVEAVMTYANLQAYNIERERDYKNPRSAISSIFSANDGWKYMKYITLVPLELDIPKTDDDTRLNEIIFMNDELSTGEYFRYAIIDGDYISALYQIKKFTDEAETSRDLIPIMYDGVVFEYTDVDLRESLGRKDSINLYAKAIKFNPIRKYTTFRGYKYTVGMDGGITPMIYYDPIMFMGTTHDHSTGSSYGRFKNLNLKIGDELIVDYVNEVMPYVTKPDNEHNRNNPNPPEEFITICPSCGSELLFKDGGKSVVCINKSCPDKVRARMTNMLAKLGIVDVAENSVDKLPFRSFKDMMKCKIEDLQLLGEANSIKFYNQIQELYAKLVPDYIVVGSLGFTGTGRTKWKTIFSEISLDEIIDIIYNKEDLELLSSKLLAIKGIGKETVKTIINELDIFEDDLFFINTSMINVINTKGKVQGRKIRCTGFRDSELMEELKKRGFDADDGASVTKDTFLLILRTEDDKNSSKGKNAIKYGIRTVTKSEFLRNMEEYLK